MRQGRTEETIREQCRLTGAPLPDTIANKPGVISGLELYWRAFTDLMSDRQIGMGEGPIPWSAISDWGFRNHIHGDDFDRLAEIVRIVDGAYMEYRNKEGKRKSAKGKTRAKKPIRRK